MPGSFRIARVLGIDVRVHPSWLLIFLLLTFQLDQALPATYPFWSEQKTLVVSLITALLFFLSVVVHEFAHAVVARGFRMSVSSITLFLLGGVASLTKEPPSAKAEFFMASAGPATSLVIGGASFGVAYLAAQSTAQAPALQPVEAVAGILGEVNIAVAVFNLIPGFPLDGGRVLRSIVWWIRRERVGATRIAARGGQIVAVLFAVWGAYRVLTGDAGGLWIGLIAYFLFGAASQSLEQERVVQAVGSARVAQIATTQFLSVPRGISVESLVRDFFLPNNVRAAPVVDGDRFVGVVSLEDLRKVEQAQWPMTSVDAVLRPASEIQAVRPEEELAGALDRFGEDLALLPVVDAAGRLVGLLYRDAVVGYVRMQEMLGFDARR